MYSEFETDLCANIKILINIDYSYYSLDEQRNIQQHLTNYFIIKACGTVEQGIKKLIANYFSYQTQNKYIKNFIDESITKTSSNPSKNLIDNLLKKFSSTKKMNNSTCKKYFEINLNEIYQSLDSLRNLRNQIAHGDTNTATFETVKKYFDNSFILIMVLKEILENEF